MLWLSSREARDVVAGEAEDAPLIQRLRPEAPVESDRGLVPVQDRPFHAPAVALDRHLREIDEQRAADAAAAPLGYDEEILEIQAAPAQKRRMVVKPHG